MKRKKVTVGDIAAAAGVGLGTVDRVLHNRGRVSAETAARVMKIVEELEYTPNRAAQILAKRKVCRIAVIYQLTVSAFWDSVKQGIEEAKEEFSQFGVEIVNYEIPDVDKDAEAHIIERVTLEGYQGIALVPFHSERVFRAIDKAVEAGIYVIAFNNDEPCKRHCYVGQDLYRSGRIAGRMMSMLAPENAYITAFVPATDIMISLEKRYEGFRERLRKLRNDITLAECFYSNSAELEILVTDVLKRESECSAIYVASAHVEIVGEFIKQHNPIEHIPLIGHDDTEKIRQYVREGIIDVTIGQEQKMQGYKAVKILCDYLILGKPILSDKYYTKTEIMINENL